LSEFPQFPITETFEKDEYGSYRNLMFMLPILLDANVIAETGLGHGHSTRIFLESLSQLSKPRALFTFEILPTTTDEHIGDIPTNIKQIAENLGVQWNLITGRSIETVMQIQKIWELFSIDFLYIDSAHEYDNVLAELNTFRPFLSDKAVIMGDDVWLPYHDGSNVTYAHGKNPTDVYYAFQKFVEGHPQWKSFTFTNNDGKFNNAGKILLVRTK